MVLLDNGRFFKVFPFILCLFVSPVCLFIFDYEPPDTRTSLTRSAMAVFWHTWECSLSSYVILKTVRAESQHKPRPSINKKKVLEIAPALLKTAALLMSLQRCSQYILVKGFTKNGVLIWFEHKTIIHFDRLGNIYRTKSQESSLNSTCLHRSISCSFVIGLMWALQCERIPAFIIFKTWKRIVFY